MTSIQHIRRSLQAQNRAIAQLARVARKSPELAGIAALIEADVKASAADLLTVISTLNFQVENAGRTP